MIISDSKKFIFIHIYKTAGTSVAATLIKHANFMQRVSEDVFVTKKIFSALNLILGKVNITRQWGTGLGNKHASANDIREFMGSDKYDDYFKFAFVRNSWDWQVSLYNYLKTRKSDKNYGKVSKMSFKQFLISEIDGNAPCQLDFLTNPSGDIIVDRIGRFESLESDLNLILKDIGIGGIDDLPCLNVSRVDRKSYQSFYDEESYELVKNYFKRDIDYFGYEF